MGWIAIGALVVVGLVVGVFTVGLASETENGTSEVTNTSLSNLRDAQRLSNPLFEIVSGEIVYQGPQPRTSETPAGERWSIRFLVRNLHETLSLQGQFWEAEAVGFDADGQEVDAFAFLPEWGWRSTGIVRPMDEATGTVLVFGDDLAAFAVTFRYAEPGRTAVETMFVREVP